MNDGDNDTLKGLNVDENENDTFIPQYTMPNKLPNENGYSSITIPINNAHTKTATHTSTEETALNGDKATFTAAASGISPASPIPHHVYESNT